MNSIVVQRLLFDFGLKKLFNKGLVFPPFYRVYYVLLIKNSKDHFVQRVIFVLLVN